MRIVGTWNPAEVTPERERMARTALLAAYDSGYTLFDHADIYCRGACEEMHGRLLRDSRELRKSTIIATKCGIRRRDEPNVGDPGRYDFSKDWILSSCAESLKRLGVEQIDIYQLHRPDVLMDPHEVAEAFDELHSRGMVRYFGVSNFLPSQLAMLSKFVRQPLVVNQVEISLSRLDCFSDGTLDQCVAEAIVPLSWSPLGGGTLVAGGESSNPTLADALDRIATKHETTRTAVALSWLLKHPSGIVPIVGSVDPRNIRKAIDATSIAMSREDWYALYVAARGANMP